MMSVRGKKGNKAGGYVGNNATTQDNAIQYQAFACTSEASRVL
jgi:hypothetical protein